MCRSDLFYCQSSGPLLRNGKTVWEVLQEILQTVAVKCMWKEVTRSKIVGPKLSPKQRWGFFEKFSKGRDLAIAPFYVAVLLFFQMMWEYYAAVKGLDEGTGEEHTSHTTLHHTTPHMHHTHYITLHCTTSHPLHHATLHYTTLHCTHYINSHQHIGCTTHTLCILHILNAYTHHSTLLHITPRRSTSQLLHSLVEQIGAG